VKTWSTHETREVEATIAPVNMDPEIIYDNTS